MDFRGWIEVPGRGEYRLSLGALKLLAEAHGMRPRGKHITPAIERRSSAFHRAFLRGLFDADGSVQGTQAKGVSVRLSQSNRDDLLAVQRMLLRLGIASTIYSYRRDAGPRELPDGQGGAKLYSIWAQHELVVANDNLSVYAERVGFADHEKAARLNVAISGYRRRPNREAFVATIEAVEEAGEAEVLDAAIPGINAFDANGFWSHIAANSRSLLTAPACWARSIWRGLSNRRSRGRRGSTLDGSPLSCPTPCGCSTMLSIFPGFRCQSSRRGANKRRIGLGVTGSPTR